MTDPSGGIPGGGDPNDPGFPGDSSLGADRAAAIDAEKKKWRDRDSKIKPAEPRAPKESKKVDRGSHT
ncbi:MAG TPA: hypothetical protein VHW65_07980 [Gemmatimonadales bacterium]|nr:hypothetical protein [Gemmatimonadales bacterium]